MLDLLTVGPKFTRPACRAAAAAIDRRDIQSDGWTLDRFMTLTAYYANRVLRRHTNVLFTISGFC